MTTKNTTVDAVDTIVDKAMQQSGARAFYEFLRSVDVSEHDAKRVIWCMETGAPVPRVAGIVIEMEDKSREEP